MEELAIIVHINTGDLLPHTPVFENAEVAREYLRDRQPEDTRRAYAVIPVFLDLDDAADKYAADDDRPASWWVVIERTSKKLALGSCPYKQRTDAHADIRHRSACIHAAQNYFGTAQITRKAAVEKIHWDITDNVVPIEDGEDIWHGLSREGAVYVIRSFEEALRQRGLLLSH